MLSIVSADRDNNNELIVDKVIRVWLCRRLYDSRWPPTPFKVDFFLPPQIPDYEIPESLSSGKWKNSDQKIKNINQIE
ncbi:unnamed protein product [Rotaria magnacalcarata]|uniref:Uncharacterized protein n=1 Tax=Rotaria magnacalcarata TaxID=392030 RepID=A0A8S2JW20_9BILA|nr:unnamed protein product [Rotaria magnacalcarata]